MPVHMYVSLPCVHAQYVLIAVSSFEHFLCIFALPRSAHTKLELLHVYRIITVVMYLPVSGGVFSATPESLPLDGQL